MPNTILSGPNTNNWITFGTTTSADGNAKDSSVQKKLLESLGKGTIPLVTCSQVHGNQVAVVQKVQSNVYKETDGLITDLSGIALGIFTADCVPVFVLDQKNKVMGLFHAGWRGAWNQIVVKGMSKMNEQFSSMRSDLRIKIGAHIQSCCYKVNEDVADMFPQDCRKVLDQQIYLSLKKVILKQVLDFGVLEENFTDDSDCTFCSNKYFSFRRNATQDRMLSYMIKEPNH